MPAVPSVAATAALIQDISEMLRSVGDQPIIALQTDTNTHAGRAEAYYQAARRRILLQGWHANTEKVTLEIDDDDHFVAPEDTLEIRAVSDQYDVLLRDGNLYDKKNNTDEWEDGPDTMEVEVIYDHYPDRLPNGLRRAIFTQAAHDFALALKAAAGSVMDTRLWQRAQDAMSDALREDADKAKTNPLNTRHADDIRGGRSRWRY